MYAHTLSCDRWEGTEDHGVSATLRATGEVVDAIRRLDGVDQTLVTVEGPGGAHIAVGGGPSGFVVYATYDGSTFHTLTDPSRGNEVVMLTCGGQEGDFRARQVVSREAAERAASWFAEWGQLAPGLRWVRS